MGRPRPGRPTPTQKGDTVIFGGHSAAHGPRPRGAAPVHPGTSTWRLGTGPARTATGPGGRRRVVILGPCGASDFELRCLAEAAVPDDVAWRWPGAYAVVEETPDAVVVHTDPAAAFPVYAARWSDGWAWSTSARMLTGLTGASIDVQRLACAVFLPSVPALAGARTFSPASSSWPPAPAPSCRPTAHHAGSPTGGTPSTPPTARRTDAYGPHWPPLSRCGPTPTRACPATCPAASTPPA